MNWFNKLFGISEEEEYKELSSDAERRGYYERAKLAADKAGQPYIAVIDTQINPDDIKNGFFELDWNNEFIEQLIDVGYTGESAEAIVNKWFTTIVKQILEEDGQDKEREVGYINIVPKGNGKSEVS